MDTTTGTPPLAKGVETHEVEVNGTTVTYHEAGQSNRDYPPIVMVHGSSGSTAGHFGFLFPMLATRHRVISIDLANPIKAGEPLELTMLEEQVVAVITHSLWMRSIAARVIVGAPAVAARPKECRVLSC